MRVRNAQPADRASIETVTLAAYQQYAAVMPALWDAYRHNIVTTLADVGQATQLVAEDAGALVGTVLLYPPGRGMYGDAPGAPAGSSSPEVRLLAVAPAARGRGVGAALMRECVARARQAGAPALTLHTADMMASAMRMYEGMGFLRAPELDFHPTPPFTVKGYRLAL